jgi:hypothetical protein
MARFVGPESQNVEDQRGQYQRRLTPDERKAAIAASYVDSALLGYGDNVLAGAMSVLPGRDTYTNELTRMRDLQHRLSEQARATNFVVRGAGMISPGGFLGAAGKLWRSKNVAANIAAPMVALGTSHENLTSLAPRSAVTAMPENRLAKLRDDIRRQ